MNRRSTEEIDALVKMAHGGDRWAVEKLEILFKPLVCATVARTVFNPEEREDAIQEGAMEIVETIRDFDISRGVYFQIFLKQRLYYRMMKRNRKKDIKTLSLDRPAGEENDSTLGEAIRDERPGAQENLERLEMTTLIQQGIHDLAPGEKRVITERYCTGMGPGAIAKKYGRSVNTIQNQHARAIKKLRKKLKSCGGF